MSAGQKAQALAGFHGRAGQEMRESCFEQVVSAMATQEKSCLFRPDRPEDMSFLRIASMYRRWFRLLGVTCLLPAASSAFSKEIMQRQRSVPGIRLKRT